MIKSSKIIRRCIQLFKSQACLQIPIEQENVLYNTRCSKKQYYCIFFYTAQQKEQFKGRNYQPGPRKTKHMWVVMATNCKFTCRQNLNCVHACMLINTVLFVLKEKYHHLISFISTGTHFGNHCCFSSQSSCHDALIRSLSTEAHQELITMYGFACFGEPRNEAAKEQK